MIDVKDVCVRLRHSVHEKGLGDNEHQSNEYHSCKHFFLRSDGKVQ